MPDQKTAKAAATKRTTKARAPKPANQTKTARDKPAPTAKAPEGLFERAVEQVTDLPTHVGHALETVGDVATSAAKQTGTLISDIAEKTGLHTPKKTVSRSTRRSRQK